MAVLVLATVNFLNVMDRFLPAVLAEPIKRELVLSDTAIGFINGFGFLVVYGLLTIPVARLADRGRARWVLGVSVALWGVMTMLGGLAHAGWQLVASRIGVAAGESGAVPISHAYIARSFAPERRGAPISIMTLSIPLAITGGLLAGGLLEKALGWRGAFVLMGAASALMAPLVVMAVAPSARLDAAAAPGGRPGSVSALFRTRSFAAILISGSITCTGGYAMTSFGPAFLMRTYGLSAAEVGLRYGLIPGAVGMVLLAAMAPLVDRLVRRDARWPLWLLVGMLACAAPLGLAAFLAHTPWISMACMAIPSTVGMLQTVPTTVAVQRIAPPDQRALASAIALLASALFGGVGPLVVGMISDALQPHLGVASLARAMLVAPAAYAVAAVCGLVAASRLRQDLEREAAAA